MTPSPTEAGLYIHIPFCSAICPYCDFAVTTGGKEARRRLVDALCAELRFHAERDECFDTIYLGGGTPSCLAPDELARVLAAARGRLRTASDAWVTLEANPEDVTPDATASWRDLGVGTVSLGVQSFDDDELRFLGRRHGARGAREAVELSHEAGFPIVSLDLIYALPGRDVADWTRNLLTATRLAPQHLSCYQLTIHEGTPFHRRRSRGRLEEAPEELQADLFLATHEVLSAAGYDAYEVSNFARAPEFRSRHNQKYWWHLPYLGVGPSAHSFCGTRRWWNERPLREYLRAVENGRLPVAGEEVLAPADLVLEVVMLGMRTTRGIDLDAIESLHGVRLLEQNRDVVERARDSGLLRLDGSRLAPTVHGLLVADRLVAELDLAPPPAWQRTHS